MSITMTTTHEQARTQGIKMLVHGPAGAGKTRLCATTGDHPSTIILSAEAGLLSLRGTDIDVAIINRLDDMRFALDYLRAGDGEKYRWVCIDSLSEIAERVLHEELDKTKDPRKAYGEMASVMFRLIKAFRDLPGRHVLMTCKTERVDGGGSLLWAPNLPGKQLSQGISYLFDEVFALRAQAKDDGGAIQYLQTVNDGYYEAKDRSGALDAAEPANLAHIVNKIQDLTTEGHEQ